MHTQMMEKFMISAMLLVLLQLHTANATDHCVDKKRGLIMDSCEDLSKFRRQQLAPRSTAETPSIVKRENALNFEPKYTLESLPRDDVFLSAPKGIKLCNVWKDDFPNGTKLIMTKENAKKLRQFDPSYRYEFRRHSGSQSNHRFASSSSEMEPANDVRPTSMSEVQHRIDKRNVHHKITACCDHEFQCVSMMCFARV